MGPRQKPRDLGERDFVFEAARIVFRGPVLRRQDSRRRGRLREPRFIVLGELYGRIIVIIYTPRQRKCRIISMRAANVVETQIYYEYTAG